MLFTDRDTRAINIPLFVPSPSRHLRANDNCRNSRTIDSNNRRTEFVRVLSCSFLPACCTLFTKNATRIILVSEEEERRGKKKRSRRSRIDFGDEFTDVRSEKAVAVESGNKGRRRRGRTRRMVEATRALIRLSRGASHTDMAGYANKTDAR